MRGGTSVEADLTTFVTELRLLMDEYQAGVIPAGTFESRFLALHSEMPLDTPPRFANAVEELFWAVESFVADPALRSAGELDETALLSAVNATASTLSSES